MTDEYSSRLLAECGELTEKNENSLNYAAKKLADTICSDGIIFVFGCGHSHLIALDCFYRAGGLACVQPILKPELMLHVSASESSRLEKNEQSAKGVLDSFETRDKDALIVVSTSGVNGAPVQAAIEGKAKGLFVTGVGSSAYFGEKSRHSSGKILKDVCDAFLDNLAPKGDASVNLGAVTVGGVSTVLSSFLVQDLLVRAEKECLARGVVPPVFGSGNVAGNADKNAALVEKYKDRIKGL